MRSILIVTTRQRNPGNRIRRNGCIIINHAVTLSCIEKPDKIDGMEGRIPSLRMDDELVLRHSNGHRKARYWGKICAIRCDMLGPMKRA